MKTKYIITRFLFTIALILCYCDTTLSQVKHLPKDGSLSIKGKEKSDSHLSNESEQHLQNYLNYNPKVDFSRDTILKKYKNIVGKKASLFVVLKCKSKEEKQLLSLERGMFKSLLSNEKMVCGKEVVLNKVSSNTGLLLSYLYHKHSLKGKRKGTLSFEDLLYGENEIANQIFEVLLLPKYPTEKEQNIIESYLSLKYGISLNKGVNYYNSKGEKIWNVKENEGFNHYITGIGRDDLTGLNQKQSKNSKEDGLSIGLKKIMLNNYENKEELNDNSYLLWGNNGKELLLEKQNDSGQKRMKRIWKTKGFSNGSASYSTQIRIDKRMVLEKKGAEKDLEDYWLVVDATGGSDLNYENAKYIKSSTSDGNELVFDGVELSSTSANLFTIIKGKGDFSKHQSTPSQSKDEASTLSNQIKIYPNPVSGNENFHIQFHLKETSKVEVTLLDMNGKTVKKIDLGMVEENLLEENLSVSGTYLIVVKVNEKEETIKLIVK